MRRTKTGWVAQTEDESSFAIGRREAAGIYLNYSRSRLSLFFAGVDGPDNDASQLPPNPNLLRELAIALQEAADELEDHGFRPHLHMLI